jgi:hypothetical protein
LTALDSRDREADDVVWWDATLLLEARVKSQRRTREAAAAGRRAVEPLA